MQSKYIEFPAKDVVAVKTEEAREGDLAPWEVILRNEVTLASAGTELAHLDGSEYDATFPVRPGYAAIGRVVARGPAVKDFAVGDRAFYAGKHCSTQRFLHGQDHQWGRLYPVPAALASEDAVFSGLAEIAMTGPAITDIDLNDTVAVFGLGLIGDLAAQLYSAAGARVIGLDPVKKRCELARQTGIATVVDAPPDKQVQAVLDLTGGKGAAVTVDAVGHSAVITNCVAAAALFGQVILLGSPRLPMPADITAMMAKVHVNGLVLRGAHMWRFPAADIRGVKQTVAWSYRTAFDLISAGRLKVSPLRSHVAKPEDAPRIYDGLRNERDRYWGVVFDWRE